MKELSNSTQRKVGVTLSYTYITLHVIIGLLYTPYMLKTIGDAENGLYVAVSGVAEMLGLFNLGFSASYIRFYSKFKKNGEYDRINSFNALFFLAFTLLSFFVIVTGLFLAFNAKIVFNSGLSEAELHKAKIMLIMLTLSIAFGFITTVFICYVGANQKFIFSKGTNVIQVLLLLIVNMLVLLSGGKAVGLTASYAGVATFMNILYIIYSFTKLNFKFDFKHIETALFKEVFLFSVLIAINLIVDKINSGIDSIIIARFIGSEAVTPYSIGAKLSGYFTTFSLAIAGVFTPMVHDLVNSYPMDSKEQRTALTELFVKVARFQYLLLMLILSGFVFFGKQFIALWVGGGQHGYDVSYTIGLVLMVPSIIPLTQNIGIEIQRAENRHYHRSYIYGIMAIFNLIISIILVQKYAGLGAAIGTGLSCIVANCIIMNIVYDKKININVGAYFKNLGKQTLGLTVPFICGILINRFANVYNWFTLLIWIAVYSVVYAVFAWFFSMNNYEKSQITKVIDKVLKTNISAKYV